MKFKFLSATIPGSNYIPTHSSLLDSKREPELKSGISIGTFHFIIIRPELSIFPIIGIGLIGIIVLLFYGVVAIVSHPFLKLIL